MSSSEVVTDLTSPIYHGVPRNTTPFFNFFFKLFVWQYDPDGYYQSNFVNDESFTRRPRYCLVFTVNTKSFTRHHRKDF
jgi:hypothetical protein